MKLNTGVIWHFVEIKLLKPFKTKSCSNIST